MKARWLRVAVAAALAVGAGMLTATQASAAPPPTCTVIIPSPGSVNGTVTLDADAPNATSVEFYLNGADFGPARPTNFGWLYSPDGGQTYGWDTARFANGPMAITCVAVGADGVTATSPTVNVTLANPTGCTVLIPTAGQSASGRQVTLDASPPAGTTAVMFHLHNATIADVPLGPAIGTGFGWLYSPDGGQTFGWDSTQYPNGSYSITCEATQPNVAPATSSAVAFSLANVVPSVNLYGRPTTFGTVANPAPSGQTFVANPVPGTNPPPGTSDWITTIAGDGTVITSHLDQNGSGIFETQNTMTLSSFNPATGSYHNINILTSTGKSSVTVPPAAGTPFDAGGASVGDVKVLPGGNAVAFLSPVSFNDSADPATDGVWPAFGILTKVNGVWQVASGSGWTNQWTGAQLAATNPTAGPAACPPDTAHPSVSICRYLDQMTVMPASGDIVITQYFGSSNNGQIPPVSGLVVLHVTGPDASGRYTTVIKSVKALADSIPDLSCSDNTKRIGLAPLGVRPDPTGVSGNEHFVVDYDQYGSCADEINLGVNDPHHKTDDYGRVVEEYNYDAATGAITPISAPILVGDLAPSQHFYSTDPPTYDHQGNLWVPRSSGLGGGPLAVYAKVGGHLKFDNGGTTCPFDSRPKEQYLSTNGTQKAWGETCKPDYDILQPQIASAGDVTEDPVSHTMALVAFGPRVVPIRTSGSGTSMTFTIGNVVDGAAGLVPGAGPCYDLTDPNGGAHHQCPLRNFDSGGFDANGRLWIAMGQMPAATSWVDIPAAGIQGYFVTPHQTADQYLYSVDQSRLFGPDAVVLSNTSGVGTLVQAEATTTVSTTQSTGGWATKTVDATGYVKPCNSFIETCSTNDGVNGDGYFLTNSAGTGIQSGTFGYTINVPSAGNYQFAYRVRSKSGVHTAAIKLTAGATTVTTPFDTANAWQTVTGATLSLAAGTQTISITPPAGGGGWDLNWISFTKA